MRPSLPVIALLGALAGTLAPRSASAYPTSVVFAPSGEALPFGGFSLSAYAGMVIAPPPDGAKLGSVWGSFDVGVVPSVDLATTSAGTIAFAGAELGVDVYGPDVDGSPTVVLNAKLQLLKEADYWPAVAVGFFQVSPDPERGQLLGYFSLSKSFTVRETALGQLTFGMMRSFADRTRIAPQCFVSGASTCLFRGSAPFEDGNGAFIAGYVSPWLGPVALSIDHVGGTSAVSSTNLLLSLRFWEDGEGGLAVVGIGGFLSNDRRASPPGPGAEDGLFVSMALISSLGGLFGWHPTESWGRDPKKKPHHAPSDPDDLLDAPPLTAPTPTATPTATPPPPAP